MVTAFTEVITTLKTRGYHPALNVMDNECSATVKKYIRSEKISIQLIPPHNHRVNAAEQAITTFKEHFITALATVDMHFPLQLWDEFLLQVELTLNMLRFSRRNPKKSANQEVYGSFDLTRHHLPHSGPKPSFTMNQHHMRPGPPTQPMGTTWARLPITTVASDSTSQPRHNFVSPTHGICIQPTARSL